MFGLVHTSQIDAIVGGLLSKTKTKQNKKQQAGPKEDSMRTRGNETSQVNENEK